MIECPTVCLITALMALGAAGAEVRTWTDNTGKYKTEAEFHGLIDRAVRLKRADGNVVSVPMTRLSDADQAYVRRMTSKPQAGPAPGESKSGIIVSQETTHWLGPLDEAGRIDFVESLNAQSQQGVTSQNNGAIDFWQAVGLGSLDPPVADRILRVPGLSSRPNQANVFVDWSEYSESLESRAPRSGSSSDPRPALSTDLRRWPWRASDHPDVAAWLEQNRHPLDLLARGTPKSRFYSPLVSQTGAPGVHSALLPHGMAAWGVAKALMTRAMLRLGAGDLDEAWRDTLACHRLARWIGQGPTTMEALVASAINEMGSDGCAAIAHHEKMTANTAARYLAELRELTPLPSIGDKLNRGVRAMLLDGACRIAYGGPRELIRMVTVIASSDSEPDPTTEPSRHDKLSDRWSTGSALDWSETLRILNREVEGWVRAWQVRSRASRLKLSDQVQKTVRDHRLRRTMEQRPQEFAQGRLPADLSPQDMANFCLSLFAPAFDALCAGEARYQMRNAMAQTAIALGAFRAEHGSYPPTLARLKPDFLSDLPRDEFADADLRYRPDANGYVLYSVGPDGEDNGGRVSADGSNGDSPVLHVPPALGE